MRFAYVVATNMFLFMLSTPDQASAQADPSQVQEQMQRVATALRACRQNAEESPLVRRWRDEIFPTRDHPNYYKALSTTERLTQEQRQLMLEALPVATKCRSVEVDGEAGLPTQRVTIEHYRQLDIVYGRLLRREISIGEAISERERLSGESNAARRRAWGGPSAQSSDSNAGSSSLLPLLMQQQLQREESDAADQRNRALIDALKPKPSTTKCIRDGWGNVTCTTQ